MAKSVVIVGAGQAGGTLAQALVDLEYPGPITLVGNEVHPPYERPPLSKELLTDKISAEDCSIWSTEMSEKVDLRLSTHATSINRIGRSVSLSKGDSLKYHILVLATGGLVRRLNVPGENLSQIFYLRTIEDSIDIRRAVENSTSSHPWLIVGAGWVGLETACSLRGLGADVIVIEPQSRICARSLPNELSSYLQTIHERHGVRFLMGQTVRRFLDARQSIAVELSTSEELTIAGAVIGVGIVPNVELAEACGLAVNDGIVVDEFGQTTDPAIYAVGDVSRHPNRFLGSLVRQQSWSNARNQAIAVANNIAGNREPFEDVPWLWSDQYDLNLQLLGKFPPSSPHVTRGALAENVFTTIYLHDDRICGAIAVNNGGDIRTLRAMIERNIAVSSTRLADTNISLKSILKDQQNSKQNA
jgi:3-phenylpropionate/trans-cinnamate dioxygenase ferredoxin reductase subunit